MSNDVQSRTAVARPRPYAQNMQTDYVKAALLAAWILSVGALGYASGTTSFAGWTLVAVLLVVPPAFMVRLWSALSPTMSETIRQELR
jgi:hypothetical protein